MSDEMGDKFKQIADMLGQNSNANIPDNVKGLLNMFMSNNTKEESPSDDISQRPKTSEGSSKVDPDDIADMTRKMKKTMNMLNPASDPKMNLLNAIKPYLNIERQKKLQTCMKLMKIGSLTKLFDDSEERTV
ncbi:MAG TPA: hypothetical protein VIK78_20945 [Ruminiclostridium sp.]